MDIPQVTSRFDAEVGEMGQTYLACGKSVAMRRWEESAGGRSDSSVRDYEIVGYLLRGRLEVSINGETAILSVGDSWLIPAGAQHAYQVLEDIIAIEATSPPGRLGNKDE